MPPKKGIGINTNSTITFIDHLVPLCQIMGIPLMSTSPWIYELIQLYYPEMPLIYDEGEDHSLNQVLEGYEVLFYVDHYRKHDGSFQFGEHFYQGPARSVCGLHGNSDKKRNLYWIERFTDEDVSLVYGQHMLDFLEEKNVLHRLKNCIVTGNYRREYYHQHKEFFDRQMKHFLFPKNGKKTLLYAPTWTHPCKKWAWRADYSNFFEEYPFILDEIPQDFQVLVKLHPLLVHIYPDRVEEIKARYEGREEISFISELPLIYPLLEGVDCYLGDYSSVGYDFLSFNRPLFFLESAGRRPQTDKGVYLHQCGVQISRKDLSQFYSIIRKKLDKDPFSEIRMETDRYAFGERKSLSTLRKEIEEATR
jgi:hypothetical protein